MSNQNPAAVLRGLLRKVASTKTAAAENVPASQHPTDKMDGGNTSVPSGQHSSELKTLTAASAQANPVDGTKLTDGKGESEQGIERMLSGEKSSVTPKEETDNPEAATKKLASLSFEDLLETHYSVATPVASELVVKAATQQTVVEEPAKIDAPKPAVTAEEGQQLKAAAEKGAADALQQISSQIIQDVYADAILAGDLFAAFHKQSMEVQAATIKRATDAPPVSPVNAMDAGGEAGGMPPEAAAAMAGGGGMPPEEAAAAIRGAGGGGDAAADALAQLPPEQIEQLLMALLEQTGSADPAPLEKAEDPATQKMAKAARAYLQEGRFEFRPAKNAQERLKINEMKQFIRETTR